MINDFYIKFHEGIDYFKFGMGKEEVHSIINDEPIVYDDIEIYEPLFTFKYKDNKVIMIMVTKNDDINVIIENINIFDLDYEEVLVFIKNIDNDVVIEEDIIKSDKLGIELLTNNKNIIAIKAYK